MELREESTQIQKEGCLYEGKAKTLFKVPQKENLVLIEFKDSLTAFNSKKKGSFKGKGHMNREISSLIFRYLKNLKIKNHWIADQGTRSMLCEKTEIIPLEVVIRNRLAGSTAKKLNQKEGLKLTQPIFELYYKKDALGDPFINEDQALFLKTVENKKEIEEIKKKAFLINEKLKIFFSRAHIDLIDFKIEFGKKKYPAQKDPSHRNQKTNPDFTKNLNSPLKPKDSLILSDEISPDCARLWDLKTQEKLDKDRFRYNLGKVKESYEKVLTQIKKAWDQEIL